jgi:D-alanyl-D-alanine carboxypeptidase
MALQSWRRVIRRRLGTAALAAAIACNPLLATAQEAGRHAVLVVDANTGRVLHDRSADAPRFPASLVKLMTLYMIFELIEQGRLELNTKVRFSANAVAAPPSNLDVEEGTEIALIDAIKALITKSANDVAVAVAEHIAGSEEKFAELMTRRARELGMKSTAFRNASGLPDPEQVTTARDMITLALRLQDQFPKYYPLFATRTFTWGGETYRNHNTLLFRYQGLDGMKTGYIRASGFNLVASARRGKKHVIAAYFGGNTAALRNAAVRRHLDAGFAKASSVKTRQPGPLLSAQAKAPPLARAKAAPIVEAKAPPPAPSKALPGIVLAVPAPQPVQRPSPAAHVEVAGARPTATAEAPEVSAGSREPRSIEALLEQTDAPSETKAAAAPAPEAPAPAAAPSGKTVAEAGPAGVPAGPFQIQVGAFNTQGEAERQLAWVSQRAAAVLGKHAPHMSQFKRGDKVFFRARYIGFEVQAAATDACTELKRLEIDCLVMRGE